MSADNESLKEIARLEKIIRDSKGAVAEVSNTHLYRNLGLLYFKAGELEKLDHAVRELHAEHPRRLKEWPADIQNALPATFDALNKTMHILARGEAAGVSRWPIHKLPPQMADVGQMDKLAYAQLMKPLFAQFAMEQTPIAEASVITFGSCFASHLHASLARLGIKSVNFDIDEEINTTFAVRQLLEHIVLGTENEVAAEMRRHDPNFFASACQKIKDSVSAATHLILTVGVALCPFEGVRFRFKVSSKEFLGDPNVVFRISSIADNKDNLEAIIRLIKSISGKIKVVLTLSPVPLSASPCGHVVADDFLSKATLRLTLDQVTRADPSVHYWPSFECAKWMGSHLPFSFFGDDGQSRHVSRWVVDYIIGSFAEIAFAKAF